MVKKLEPKKLSQEEKVKILKTEVALLNKKFGKEVISIGYNKEIERIPFQSAALNEITGGVPMGRFSVIWGPKGSAKSTTALDLIKTAQGMGKICYWIDLEHSFDPKWAQTMGVDTDTLIVASAFNTAEEAMDSIVNFTKKKIVDVIVIDSIQGLSPKGEQETKKGIDKSLEDETMALLARKLSQFFRISATGVAQSNCTVIMIGQTRMDLGGFITLEKLSGGNALEHWSSMTIHFRRGKKADAPKDKDKILGFDLVARVDKSKVGADEGKQCHIPFYFEKGIEDVETKKE